MKIPGKLEMFVFVNYLPQQLPLGSIIAPHILLHFSWLNLFHLPCDFIKKDFFVASPGLCFSNVIPATTHKKKSPGNLFCLVLLMCQKLTKIIKKGRRKEIDEKIILDNNIFHFKDSYFLIISPLNDDA